MSTGQKVKCVFLDRDGVLNVDLNDYLYNLDDLVIPEGVPEALKMLKAAGYLLVVITNQAGIAKGRYTSKEVYMIHDAIQTVSDRVIDAIYYAPYHPEFSGNSLSRKPGTLMLEKATAKYNIDLEKSWMVGDRDGDMQAGKKMGVKTIHILPSPETSTGDFHAQSLWEAAKLILFNSMNE